MSAIKNEPSGPADRRPITQVHTADRLVSVRATAAALGCSVATVWRGVANGTLPQPVRIGGMTRWSVAEIEAFISAAKAEREAA